MRNLKKVLALVLAMAMSLSLAVTAGAAFNDQDKIVNEEAVEVCSALNIINGYTDGSFKPEGNVTRAEAAKMITIALNGGKEPTLSASATPTYTDISGHWAAKYIEYCTSLGIVAGDGAGKFNPNGNVKAVELAKMLLIALGYNAEHEKFVGKNWDTNVNVVASQKGLYEDLETIDPSAAATRDTAAQMVWNALQALTVKYDYTLVGSNGNLNSQITVEDTDSTLLWTKYKALIEDAGIMTGVAYDEKNDDFNTTVSGLGTFDAAEDFSALMGQNVKVVYKPEYVDQRASVDTLYGIYATDKNEIVTAMIGDADSATPDKVELNNEEYELAGANFKAVAPNGAEVTVAKWGADWSKYPYFEVSIINNNTNVDDVFEYGVVTPFTVDKIDYVGVKTFSADKAGSFEFDKVNVYEGVAEDDYVVIVDAAYTVDDTTVITKADVISGEVTVVNGDEYTIGGEVYTADPQLAKASKDALALTNEVEAVVVNGYIFAAEKVDGAVTMDDVVYVTLAKVDNDYATKTVIAKATFADGTASEIEVVEVDGVKGNDLIAKVDADKTEYKAIQNLYKYEVEDGEYTLTKITVDKGSVEGDYDTESYTKTAGDGKIAGLRADDDAVVFVRNTKNEITVVTGADVKAWDKTTLTSAYALANETSGVQYVELAVVALTTEKLPGATADAVYGYVTKALGQTKEGDDFYNSYVIWTATGEQTIKVEAKTDDKYTAGETAVSNFVKFEDGVLENVATADVTTLTGIADDGALFFGGSDEYVVTDDTQVIYINAADEVGAEGGALKVAKDLNSQGTLEENVYGVAAAEKNSDEQYELTFLFVDINNDIKNTLGN